MEDQIDLMDPLAVDDAAANLPEVRDEEAAPETDELREAFAQDAGELEDTANINTTETEDAEEEEEAKKRRLIFICHRQVPGLDEEIASLIRDELRADFGVYLDQAQPGGTLWRKAIQEAMDNADFVVALVTDSFNQINADWIAFELSVAHQRQHSTGKPRIIPVHLERIDQYRTHIGAYLSENRLHRR